MPALPPPARRPVPAGTPSAARLPGAIAGAAACLALAAAPAWAFARDQPPAPRNVLLIIADDLGVDRVGAYGAHPNPGHTPVLDRLAAEGILFRNVWANPACSPTRATLLTGRHAFRTGVGAVISDDASYTTRPELGLEEVTLPKLLGPAYRTAVLGKWHLTTSAASGPAHPLLMGFDHHRGPMSSFPNSEGQQAYFDWQKNVDGTLGRCTTYATTDAVDEALDLIRLFSAPPDPRPWFLWLAFNAPHKPYHRPPAGLHSFRLPGRVRDPIYMKALTEAMDTEIGRLLDAMDPAQRANTVVIFIGDNGTNGSAVTPPFPRQRAKRSLWQGGIHVPLIIAGPGVARGAECSALVNSTDLFATVAELAGLPLGGYEDSLSLVPYLREPRRPSQRRWLLAEMFWKADGFLNWQRTVRDERYKLLVADTKEGRKTKFFDLLADPFEEHDLMRRALSGARRDHYQRLLERIADPDQAVWTSLGGGQPGNRGVPALFGSGALAPGEPGTVVLGHAPAGAPLLLWAGPPPGATPPRFGGPGSALALVALGHVDPASGRWWMRSPRPPALPPGFCMTYRAVVADPSAPGGWAQANTLALRAP